MSQKTETSAAPLAEPQISKVRNLPFCDFASHVLNSSKHVSKNFRFMFTFTNYCNMKT